MSKKLLYVSLFSISWSLNIILDRYLLRQGLRPLSLLFQTLFIAALIIFIYIFTTTPKDLSIGSKRSHFGALLSGIIGGGVANIFSILGLQLSKAINYGFLIKTAGAFNVTLAFFILHEPIKRIKAVLLFMMLIGAYLLSTNGRTLTPHIGDSLILIAAFGFGLSSVLNRKVLKQEMKPSVVSLYRAALGCLVAGIGSYVFGGISIESKLIPLIMLNGLLSSLLIIFLNKALKVAASSYVAMISMSVPVMVAIMGMVIFKETLTPIQWFGGSLIVLGGILTEVKKVAHHD